MYCLGASQLEHNRFTQFNLSALSKREKSLMSKPSAVFLREKGSLFYFGGFVIPNKLNMILFASLLKSLGVLMMLQIKTSFENANVLIIFILPKTERSFWDHMFNVFFNSNLS